MNCNFGVGEEKHLLPSSNRAKEKARPFFV